MWLDILGSDEFNTKFALLSVMLNIGFGWVYLPADLSRSFFLVPAWSLESS